MLVLVGLVLAGLVGRLGGWPVQGPEVGPVELALAPAGPGLGWAALVLEPEPAERMALELDSS